MALNLKINGKPYKVSLQDYPLDTTLNTFIRQRANLSGTKFMCLEGGCGVCICVVKGRHPDTGEFKTWATNSCLTLLNVCDGWEIITIEGIGNKKDGYHPIQTRLAHLNGTQCGYCSPGMVMNMYGLLESKNGKVSMEDIENSFGGNICRCTGYRPILDAMKSFGADSIPCERDIEDLSKICQRTGGKCTGLCGDRKNGMKHVRLEDDTEWIQAHSVDDILEALEQTGSKRYILVAGNTAHGVYRRSANMQIFIDVNKVAELHSHHFSGNELELGANLNLTETMDILQSASSKPGFEFCEKMRHHIDLIANVPVRNMGTLAGNLSIKHQHKEFPSDLYIMLEALDAKIIVISPNSKIMTLSVKDYLQLDMRRKVITKIILAARPKKDFLFNSYKIMPRAQNAHAYVNASFLLQMSDDVVQSARLCLGGINASFSHASMTEKYLVGKKLFANETIQGAMEQLEKEIDPDWVLPDASPEYRRKLACGLFYKFILGAAPPESVKKEYLSGGDILHRPLSSGTQTFDTREDMYPITKAIPKIEAVAQCSGEAFYMNDLAPIPSEVWAAFVHATKANAKIAKIDPKDALSMSGVVAFYSAKDIPGVNYFVVKGMLGFEEDEEIFCSKRVSYHSQPLGVIVAESPEIARMAGGKVRVIYEKMSEPVMPTMEEVFQNKAYHKIHPSISISGSNPTTNSIQASKHIQGNFDIGSQYHYTMEPQTCVCIPTEDGMDVYSAAQWMDFTQTVIAKAINMKKSSIFLQVRRLGGGYGSKISRNNQIACACALACALLNRPVRFVQSIESMMSSLGKRLACHSDYEVNVEVKGKIASLKNTFYEDCGYTVNESPVAFLSILTASNCYNATEEWKLDGKNVKTDAPSHTWCRAPGALEGIAMMENIIEHVAFETKQDPADVRLENLKPGEKMETLLPEFLKSTDYKGRLAEIAEFNKENRWRKKGLGLAIMKYPQHYFGIQPATVSIYQGDGSVSISHGGIEMGQGLNTKVAQVAAYVLGIPLDTIRIHPSDSLNGANAIVTGGGVASETVCYAAKKACEELLDRMKPIRESLKNPTWVEIVQKCYESQVSLIASHSFKPGDLQTYDVWGLCLSEVEIDILTGNLLITRVDILEDTGESLSPSIDVGQIEGAFIMGVGYWLSEKLVFDRQTGELLTTRTWNYKPPGAKDIPIDFRVTLLQKSPNPAGFLRSKATGEPASCLAIAVLFALRRALESARIDAGQPEEWFHLGAPTTPEDSVLNSGTSVKMFALN